jgi:hypothetical protein
VSLGIEATVPYAHADVSTPLYAFTILDIEVPLDYVRTLIDETVDAKVCRSLGG